MANPDKLKRFSLHSPAPRDDPDYMLWYSGVEEGRADMKKRVLTMLQERFMNPKVDQTSPEGAAMLALATVISQDLRADG